MHAKLKRDIYTHNSECDKKAGDRVTVKHAGRQFMPFYGRVMDIYQDTITGAIYPANMLEL